MASSLDRILRTLKPEKRTAPLVSRTPAELIAATSSAPKSTVVPDTTVYVHAGQGKLPPQVADILQRWPVLHCSVALGEIAHGIGRLDPAHEKTPARRAYLENVVRQAPQHRLLNPDDDDHLSAGILTGILARLLNLPNGAHRQRINDILILLTARKAGAAVLTANVGDFDQAQQLVPDARVLYYDA